MNQTQRLIAMYKAARLINVRPDLQEAFTRMAQEANGIACFDRISLAVPVQEGKEMEIFAARGAGEGSFGNGFRCPLEGTILQQLILGGERVVRKRLAMHSPPRLTDQLLMAEDMRSHVAFPLIYNGKAIGSLNFASRDDRLCHPRNLEVLEPLVEEIAMALGNFHHYEQLRNQSASDSLTGLCNRHFFEKQLDVEIQRALRKDRPVTLIMADLDKFKTFNDLNGHLLGDEALRDVATIMRANLRSEDIAARYGGEEFVILLGETYGPTAMVVAERLRQKVEGFTFKTSPGIKGSLTISLGIAAFPKDAHNIEWLFRRADQALYMAKKQGRNRACLFSRKELSLEELSLEELVKEELSEGIIMALAAAVDAKDSYTYRHSEAVSKFAASLAEKIELSPEEVDEIKMAGLVHDVGKIGIPEGLLHKPTRLSPKEWEIIKEHPRLGCNILKHVPSLKPLNPAVLHHHERYDGAGYPDGLKGLEIPLGARVLCLADSYHAIISDRPYRPALSYQAALAELKDGAGTQFDPELLDAFLAVISVNPAEPAKGD